MSAGGGGTFDRHWRLWVLFFWLAACALLLYAYWNAIYWFALGDTDDNMRMSQVRALLHGQGWYDLRQHKLDPPIGADIHWSRIVDLPIAALKLLFQPVIGGPRAEMVAIAVAPMLPMGVAMVGIALTVRRLLGATWYPLGIGLMLCAHSARLMWIPTRIDHHGWQLAMLSLALAALVDRKPARGGLLLGFATAFSLSIGLETLLNLAVAGGVTGLMWVRDRAQAPRLAAYGASLAGGCAFGFLVFASYANRAPVCDAFSPVWLSALVAAGAASVLLAWASPEKRLVRLGLAVLAGAVIAAGFVYSWPHCLGRLEGASPELRYLWLSRVREALPLYKHELATLVAIASLPVIGAVGYLVMIWRARRDEPELTRWAAVGALALLSGGLLLWQTRAGPAAQLLAVPGAAALGWLLIPRVDRSSEMLVRVIGTVGTFFLISGLAGQFALQMERRVFPPPPERGNEGVEEANSRCPTLPALHPVSLQPRGNVLTFIDLGPRLITVTHHTAIAGPYHRNGAAIIDVMRAFRGDDSNALRTIEKRHVDYVLICPRMSESTIYAAEAPKGFYVELAGGKAPPWLQPIDLGPGSPYRMWRVVRPRS
jgi:hypothetical protein